MSINNINTFDYNYLTNMSVLNVDELNTATVTNNEFNQLAGINTNETIQQQIDGIDGGGGGGGSTLVGYWGSFWSSSTQTIANANTVYKMTVNNADPSNNGVSYNNNSRIQVDNKGVYNIQFSAQIDKTNSGSGSLDIWFRKNGTDIVQSNTRFDMDGIKKTVASWNYVIDMSGDDYVEIAYSATDNGIYFASLGTQTSPTRPAIPSIIITVQQIANTLEGPAGINGTDGQGYTFRGSYSSIISYVPYDNVVYEGSLYTCVLASLAHLPTDATYWRLVASKGDTGATGATGQGYTWLGAFNALDTYVPYDMMEYEGSSYVCIVGGATAGTLPTNTDYFELVASKGDTGSSFVLRGTYDSETAYSVLDIVNYNGSSYACKLASTGNVPTNTTYWDLIAQKGDKGDKGDRGEKVDPNSSDDVNGVGGILGLALGGAAIAMTTGSLAAALQAQGMATVAGTTAQIANEVANLENEYQLATLQQKLENMTDYNNFDSLHNTWSADIRINNPYDFDFGDTIQLKYDGSSYFSGEMQVYDDIKVKNSEGITKVALNPGGTVSCDGLNSDVITNQQSMFNYGNFYNYDDLENVVFKIDNSGNVELHESIKMFNELDEVTFSVDKAGDVVCNNLTIEGTVTYEDLETVNVIASGSVTCADLNVVIAKEEPLLDVVLIATDTVNEVVQLHSTNISDLVVAGQTSMYGVLNIDVENSGKKIDMYNNIDGGTYNYNGFGVDTTTTYMDYYVNSSASHRFFQGDAFGARNHLALIGYNDIKLLGTTVRLCYGGDANLKSSTFRFTNENTNELSLSFIANDNGGSRVAGIDIDDQYNTALAGGDLGNMAIRGGYITLGNNSGASVINIKGTVIYGSAGGFSINDAGFLEQF